MPAFHRLEAPLGLYVRLFVAVAWVSGATALHAAGQGGSQSAVDALLKAGAVRDAVARFDAEVAAGAEVNPDVLARLASAVLGEVADESPDPSAAVEACLTLLAEAPHRCEARVMADADRSPVTRLRLNARRLAGQSAATDRVLADVIGGIGERDWVAVIDAAPEFPPPLAVRLLTRALAEDGDDIRFGALDALSRIEHPSALPILRVWATRESVPGRLLALSAVARSGDAEAIRALKRLLPDLHGQDLLAAGVALASAGDPDGNEALAQVLRGPEELLHLEAAAALDALGNPQGRGRLESELGNPNVWLRLKALEQLRRSPGRLSPAVWRQMNDGMAWVRVRAAQVTLEAVKRSSQMAPR